MPEQVKIPGLVGGLAQVTARDLPQTRAALTKETEARVKKFVSPFLKVLDRARTVRLIVRQGLLSRANNGGAVHSSA